MTEAEISNLKIGDKFTIEFEVADYDYKEINAKLPDGGWYATFRKTGKELAFATKSTPAPKFEVGDTVRVIPDPLTGTVHNGGAEVNVEEGSLGKIVEGMDETGDYIVLWAEMQEDERNIVSVHCFELVKKAERDKYEIHDHCSAWAITYEHANITSIAASFSKSNHPDAEAAAKAECDRLNADWRKQQESAKD